MSIKMSFKNILEESLQFGVYLLKRSMFLHRYMIIINEFNMHRDNGLIQTTY